MKDLQPQWGSLLRWCLTFLAGIWTSALLADQFLPVLETKAGVYSNVTVTLKTPRDIHIRHDRGIVNIDLVDLDSETRAKLGYEGGSEDVAEEGGGVAALPGEWLDALQRAGNGGATEVQLPIEIPTAVSSGILLVVLVVGLVFHLFFSYCGRLICIKTGNEPGVMIWLPVFQIFPMLRAAGMSGWWVLGLFVPVLNLVVQILWCINIVKARDKHVIWTILLILPLVNLVAFLYLAFSSDGTSRESIEYPAYSPRTA
jgi:hypothetical protein